MVVLSGLGVTLSALVIQAVAGSLAIEAIDALFARRSVGTSVWRNGLATVMLIRPANDPCLPWAPGGDRSWQPPSTLA
jgi:hypothetical protein